MGKLNVKHSVVALLTWLSAQVLIIAPVSLINSAHGYPVMQGMALAMLLSQLLELAFLLVIKYYRSKELVEKVRPGIFFVAVIMGFSAFYAINILSIPLNLEDYAADVMVQMASSVWGAIAICLAGPISEEVIFRRVIMREIAGSTGHVWVGILASALIFALIHGNPAQSAFAFPTGIILGWTYYKTGSLMVPIVIHVLNNTVSFISLKLDMADDPLISDPSTIITLVLCLAVAVAMTIILNRKCGM